jgi:hypothetical protein
LLLCRRRFGQDTFETKTVHVSLKNFDRTDGEEQSLERVKVSAR